ncbi:hypothetical protein AUP68_16261 [Ilyonectria robusta]
MAGLEDEFVGGEAERSRSWREAWDVVRGSWGRPGLLATGYSFRLLEDRAPRATTRSERARARARCGEKEGSEERGVFERERTAALEADQAGVDVRSVHVEAAKGC